MKDHAQAKIDLIHAALKFSEANRQRRLGGVSMPGLGNRFPRVAMMPSGLADRIANQVASQKARHSTVSIAVRFRKREFRYGERLGYPSRKGKSNHVK